MVELVLDRKIRVDDRALRPAQHFRQAMVVLRAHDKIDGALLAKDFRAFGLGDASGDRDLGRLSAAPARFSLS